MAPDPPVGELRFRWPTAKNERVLRLSAACICISWVVIDLRLLLMSSDEGEYNSAVDSDSYESSEGAVDLFDSIFCSLLTIPVLLYEDYLLLCSIFATGR